MDREVLKQISERYETPAYVFDLDMLCERIQMMEGILGGDCPKTKLDSHL